MTDEQKHPAKRTRALFLGGTLLAVLAAVLLAVLLVNQRVHLQNEAKAKSSAAGTGPRVRVITATPAPTSRTVIFVGEARPYAMVTLYSKVSGYLKEINVDKGDRVTAGQIIAVIESPEIDRQYDAAMADAKNKRLDAERLKILVQKEYISRQDADNARAAARIAEANAAAAKAQKDYEILRAPFPGTVTARFADPGALVQSATSAQTTALPVVTLSQIDRLRVYVYLDQNSASFIRVGDPATVFDAARPDVKLTATVTRMTGELDVNTRTLLTEIDVDNRHGTIIPGSFVRVSLSFKTPASIEIPAQALVMRDQASFVALLTDDNRVTFRPVTISESDGQVVRLHSGLKEGERIILNLGQSIAEGQQVQPIETPSSRTSSTTQK